MRVKTSQFLVNKYTHLQLTVNNNNTKFLQLLSVQQNTVKFIIKRAIMTLCYKYTNHQTTVKSCLTTQHQNQWTNPVKSSHITTTVVYKNINTKIFWWKHRQKDFSYKVVKINLLDTMITIRKTHKCHGNQVISYHFYSWRQMEAMKIRIGNIKKSIKNHKLLFRNKLLISNKLLIKMI